MFPACDGGRDRYGSFFVLLGAGWQYGRTQASGDPLYLRATTASFSAIVMLQIVNAFLNRMPRTRYSQQEFSGNPLIWGGVVLETGLVALINYTSLGNVIFMTVPIGRNV
jgi:sodium/potassium-transporting ATPase subunit alpha